MGVESFKLQLPGSFVNWFLAKFTQQEAMERLEDGKKGESRIFLPTSLCLRQHLVSGCDSCTFPAAAGHTLLCAPHSFRESLTLAPLTVSTAATEFQLPADSPSHRVAQASSSSRVPAL